jgi:hypothetical protein
MLLRPGDDSVGRSVDEPTPSASSQSCWLRRSFASLHETPGRGLPPAPICAWPAARPALADDPPPLQDQGAGLLPLLDAPPSAAGHPGPGRRDQVDGGGALPDRQGPVWPGPASAPPLALLVPLGHPGHARPRLPGRGDHDRTQLPAATVGAHPVDLQRDPAPVCGPGRPPGRRSRPPAALVSMATPTSGTRPSWHYRRQAAWQPEDHGLRLEY